MPLLESILVFHYRTNFVVNCFQIVVQRLLECSTLNKMLKKWIYEYLLNET